MTDRLADNPMGGDAMNRTAGESPRPKYVRRQEQHAQGHTNGEENTLRRMYAEDAESPMPLTVTRKVQGFMCGPRAIVGWESAGIGHVLGIDVLW